MNLFAIFKLKQIKKKLLKTNETKKILRFYFRLNARKWWTSHQACRFTKTTRKNSSWWKSTGTTTRYAIFDRNEWMWSTVDCVPHWLGSCFDQSFGSSYRTRNSELFLAYSFNFSWVTNNWKCRFVIFPKFITKSSVDHYEILQFSRTATDSVCSWNSSLKAK